MKSIQEFEQFFNISLKTDLANLDLRRKRIVNRFLIMFFLIFIPIVAASVLLEMFMNINNIGIIGSIAAVIIAVLVFIFWVHDKLFYNDFKSQVINRIVYFISPELQYSAKDSINVSEFVTSRLFMHNVDRFKGDDLVFGRIDKTAFRFSEIKAEYKTTTVDSKGNRKTQWHTLFKGLFFIADFNKDFKGSTVVLPNELGKGFAFLKKLMSIDRREKLVQLEDVNFTKEFNVYGDDQIQSRYILSTSLMERILQYRIKSKNHIYLSFVDSKMYLGIAYSKNLFEPSYLKSMINFELVKTYFEDMILAVSIVEDLNLNLRIWTKE